MTTNEVIGNLENKAFNKSKKLTGVEQLNLENEWTDYLLNLISLGNTRILKSFRYRLDMEEMDEED